MRGEPCVECQSPHGVKRAPRQGDGQRRVEETNLGEEGSLVAGQPGGRSWSPSRKRRASMWRRWQKGIEEIPGTGVLLTSKQIY